MNSKEFKKKSEQTLQLKKKYVGIASQKLTFWKIVYAKWNVVLMVMEENVILCST